MPLTNKGEKIMNAMEKQYGSKAKEVFYASANKGTISGVHRKDVGAESWVSGGRSGYNISTDSRRKDACPQTTYMDACRRGDAGSMKHCADQMMRGRIVR